MHHHAPNPAARPHLSLNAFSVPFLSGEERNGSGERPSFHGTLASSEELRFGRTSAAEKRECDFGPVGAFRSVSRLLHGHCFGAKPAPCGSASFCFGFATLSGSRFLPKQVCKRAAMRRTNFFRAPPRKHSLALGSRAHFAY